MWQWYLGAAILDLIGLAICLYFVFRHKRKAKAIEHYEDIRDELTVRKEITSEAIEETCSGGILGRLVGAFVVILVGFSIMGAMTETLESPELNVTSQTQQTIIDLMPLMFALGILCAGVAIAFQGLRSAGIMGI